MYRVKITTESTHLKFESTENFFRQILNLYFQQGPKSLKIKGFTFRKRDIKKLEFWPLGCEKVVK